MEAVYIGIRTPGTTSQLRADTLCALLPSADWNLIDTDVPFRRHGRLMRSLAFRLRVGTAVADMNREVLRQLGTQRYSLAWVDKGVCLWPETIRAIRRQCDKMVYYTPDTSFFDNSSRFVNATINEYDAIITTKSFELGEFGRRVSQEKLLLVTQSYDQNLHYPRCHFHEKRPEAVLIGLCEPNREHCVQTLIDAGIPVRIGGQGWEAFLARNKSELLHFEGSAVFGDHYADVLSRASIGLGLVTKRFPELHTTRTFEMPACGTALATESNLETTRYFDDSSAIFFRDFEELAQKIRDLFTQPEKLRAITEAGYQRVTTGMFSNRAVLSHILKSLGFSVSE